MKRVIFVLLSILPLFLYAQTDCDFFEKVIIQVEKTQINTTASDFGPSFVNNELWYSSFTNKEIKKISSGITKNIFYNVFALPVDMAGNLVGEKQIKLEDLNSGYHAGPVSYCSATKELFVTFSNFENPDITNKVFQKADIRLKIVILKEVDGEWKIEEELPFNSPAYSVGHPAISITGDTLFFSSNIPDYGSGETDLYMTVRKNDEWVKWVNLGDQINTSGDDMFPVLFKNNMLIFASNGRSEGKGGLDMYSICIDENGFSSPQNISELNSTEDDFGLILHSQEKVGYYVSRKLGGKGDDDIYKVVFDKEELFVNEVLLNKEFEIKGKVIDNETLGVIPNALVFLMDCDGKQIAKTKSNSKGDFSFLTAQSECLKARATKNPYGDDEQLVGDDNYVVLKLKGEFKLELLVQDNKTLNPLANVTVKFNDNVFFESDNNGLIKRGLARNTNYVATSELEGYMNESVSFTTIGRPFGTIRETIKVEKVEVGQKFTMGDIFYDYDKWYLLPESETELNKLVKIMNDNLDWKVELGSHTDCRGSDPYNKLLSQKRSDSAVGYIIDNGISKNRIVAKGYGETQLVNECDEGVKCSDAEHRKNRRTEFKILRMDEN